MIEVIESLKSYARTLHHHVLQGDSDLLQFINDGARQEVVSDVSTPTSEAIRCKRRHVLAAIARRLGFRGWPHLRAVLAGTEVEDLGTGLCTPKMYGHTNIWCAHHAEAARIRTQTGGYLLGWKHQFLVVEPSYVEQLGLDPQHPDWKQIEHDWARPADLDARARLYGRLFDHQLG